MSISRFVLLDHFINLKHHIHFTLRPNKFADTPKQLKVPKVEQVKHTKRDSCFTFVLIHFKDT